MHGLNEIISINYWASECGKKQKLKLAKAKRVKLSLNRASASK